MPKYFTLLTTGFQGSIYRERQCYWGSVHQDFALVRIEEHAIHIWPFHNCILAVLKEELWAGERDSVLKDCRVIHENNIQCIELKVEY